MAPGCGTYPTWNPPSGGFGSVFFTVLPYVEQENLYRMGADGSRSAPLKVLRAPLDASYPDSGTFELPAAANPPWATASNTTWGLSSYSANWQVFGDQNSAVTIAPQSGVSQNAVAYGVMINDYQPENPNATVDQATHDGLWRRLSVP